MIGLLKKLGGMQPDSRVRGYEIVRYGHPDGGSKVGLTGKRFATSEEAEDYCSRPEASFKEGETQDWWFEGYVEAGSKTGHLTLWRALAAS